MYKVLAKLNKMLLPSFTKQRLDPAKAKKWQLAILAWRYYVVQQYLKFNRITYPGKAPL